MKRRRFIKSSLYASSGVMALTSIQGCLKSDTDNDSITGFIISDAHIGWKSKDQPSIELQSEAVSHIKDKFPNLDLVFDTGDIHHGNLSESERLIARNQWLSNMANIFSQSLFHYIPGNHELGRGVNDTELTASKLGSQNLKPYYSFDYKGIHFISLPQLLDTVLINQESLDWLTQDLEVNKSKTTLILSHNSIDQTTFSNGESGYRVVINSDEVLNIINKHNNVIAWLHGHNHQYEIVKKHKRLYVSNGRIGGFNPPKEWGNFGQGHLGGVYFKINKKGIEIKCYSATSKKFFEELGNEKLSNSLTIPTSFSKSAPTNYYYGCGALTSKVQLSLYNHYLSHKPSEIFLQQNNNNIINDNYDFRYRNDLFFAGRQINRIMGYQVQPKPLEYHSINSGLQIKNTSQHKSVFVKFPSQKMKKQGYLTRGSYYRCFPKDKFNISLSTSLDGINKNTKVLISYIVRDQKHNNLFASEKINTLRKGNKFMFDAIEIPEQILDKDNKIKYYLHTTLEFIKFPDVFTINFIKLVKILSSSSDKRNMIRINNGSEVFSLQNNKLTQTQFLNLSMPYAQSKTSLLIKVPNVQWQIRNAIAVLNKSTINVFQYRHDFQNNQQVIIVPTLDKIFYVNEVTNIMPFDISYLNKKIVFECKHYIEESFIVIKINSKPKSVIGANIISQSVSFLRLKVNSRTVEITV